jgi:Transposase DDE domain
MQLGQGRGMEVCDNVQTAVDSKHKLFVANDVPNDTSDRDCLSPVALQANDILGGTFEAVADVGYYHGEAVKTCLEAGITPYVARPLTSAKAKLGLCSKDDVRYDQATDTSQCPAGVQLTFRFDAVEPGRPIRYYATPACGGCALKPQCTRRQGGRRITRWVDEHPCGTMKRWWDAGYFLCEAWRRCGRSSA